MTGQKRSKAKQKRKGRLRRKVLLLAAELVVLAGILTFLVIPAIINKDAAPKVQDQNSAVIIADGSPEEVSSSVVDETVSEVLQENITDKVSEQLDENAVQQEAQQPSVDPDSPAGRAQAKGLPEPPAIDVNSWEYLLVNASHTIGEDYAPRLAKVSSKTSTCEADERITEALSAFTKAAEAEGLPVYLSSSYRSYKTQSTLFANKVAQVGKEKAATIVAPPGTSEHQTGLSADITDIYRKPKTSALEKTATYQWMSAHCQEYGFIVRFPNNKSDITGIIYEPWHFRYVGVEAATYIMANGLCLEEFIALYTGEEPAL